MTEHNLFYYPYASFTNAQAPLLKVAAIYFDKIYILDPEKRPVFPCLPRALSVSITIAIWPAAIAGGDFLSASTFSDHTRPNVLNGT